MGVMGDVSEQTPQKSEDRALRRCEGKSKFQIPSLRHDHLAASALTFHFRNDHKNHDERHHQRRRQSLQEA
jgi:hypothetical protein